MLIRVDLKRARETADEVFSMQKSNPDRDIIPDLMEISWGTWEGQRNVDMTGLRNEWKQGNYEGTNSISRIF